MDAQNSRSSDFKLIISYIAILLVSLLVPFIYFFSIIIVPIPLIVYSLQNKRDRVYVIVVAIAVITFLLTYMMQTLLFIPLFIVFAISGLSVGLAIQQDKKAYETWIQGIVGYIVSLLFVFVFTQFVLEINWAEEIRKVVNQSIENVISILAQLDPTLQGQFQEQLQALKDQLYYIPNIIPAGLAILSVIFAFLTQWLSYKVINKMHKRRLSFPPVGKLNLPKAVIFIYLIGFLMMFMESNPSKGLFIVGQNITSLMFFLIILQGLTFMFFYAKYKKQSNLLPIIISIISLVIPFLLYVIHFVGLFDLALSLRRRMEGSQKG